MKTVARQFDFAMFPEMTPQELELERQYLVAERLGMMCGTDEPTEQQKADAEKWAGEQVERLKSNAAMSEAAGKKRSD